MSHLDPDHPIYVADVRCPVCGAVNHVAQVQGERCPGCGFETKLFLEEEEDLARDFLASIAGEKHLVDVPGWGFAVVHE